MIRILHVLKIMNRGGAETMIMNFYRTMDRDKFQFDFLVCVDQDGDYDDEIKRLGGRIYKTTDFKGYNYYSYKQGCVDFFNKHNNYDIVHGHMASTAGIYLKEAKKHGMITIAHSHNPDFKLTIEGALLKILAYSTRNIADYFFACSRQAGIDRYGNQVVDSNRFFVINNGIEVNQYKYSDSRHAELKQKMNLTDKIVYGHVGRFISVKNHEHLLNVFSEILEKQKAAVLLLIGRGPLEEKMKQKAKNLHIENNVFFLGVREDIADLMIAMDCFIFPSIFEGLGIALIEAQAAGLPCVVSNSVAKEAWITENVVPLSLQSSTEKWVNAALNATSNMQMRKDMTAIIRENNFDVNDVTLQLESIYESFLR